MATKASETTGKLETLVAGVQVDEPRDVYVYAGALSRANANRFLDQCHPNHDDALLLLATYGGDADAAYKVAHCLGDRYPQGQIQLMVDVECKSAGTIVALGAHELIISDRGELGPLDVQVRERDELQESHSGLVPAQTMASLQEQSFQFFERCFLNIYGRSGRQITTRTAAELATSLTVGLLQPIFAQIDPLRLGDIARSMRVANLYGERLKTQNLKPGALDRLINSYPSHSFVIDRAEAETLFHSVRAPSEQEGALAEYIRPLMVDRVDDDDALIVQLDEPKATKEAPDGGEGTEGAKAATAPRRRGSASDGATRAGGGRPVRRVRQVSGKRTS